MGGCVVQRVVVTVGNPLQHVDLDVGNPVISFSGDIDLATAPGLAAAIEPWLEAGGPVTIDVSAIAFLDAAGAHLLAQAARTVGDRGCIIVHGASEIFREVVPQLGLDLISNLHVMGCGSEGVP